MFKHYILCRYNHRLYADNPYNVADPDSWMRTRHPLFERMLRSLANQSNADFHLLLTVDPRTPNPLRRQVEMSLEESGVAATIVDVAPMDWLRRQAPEAEYLLTSRLDNDDEYLPQFVAAVQAAFSPTTQVLDVQGVQSDGLGYFTIHREEPNSPFISLVEPWHDVKTAHFENHTKMAQIFPARFIGSEILYIQHVHTSNVSNKISGNLLSPDEASRLPPLATPKRASGPASAARKAIRRLLRR